MIKSHDAFDFIPANGEMANLIRNKDWDDTSLGDPHSWPKSLKTILGVILHSKFPMFIWWGPDLICLYNDAYRPSLGAEGKHPSILGKPAKEAWEEIWPVIYPLITQVLEGGDATWSEDQLIPIYRNGNIEDVFWTFSYSRINNDNGIGYGVLVTCVETTQKVINQKKLEEAADLLRFSTESAELGTWDYNPHTGRFTSNWRLKKWFGLGAEEEVDLQTAISVIALQDRQRVTKAIALSLDPEIRAPYDIEFAIADPFTSAQRLVVARGKAYFDSDRIAYRFSGIMEDVTERRLAANIKDEADHNLRRMIEQAPVAICVLKGPRHIVEIANDMMIRLWGKTQEKVMFRPMFEGLPEAKNQGLERILDNVYQTGERYTAKERAVNLPRATGIETVYQNFVYEPLRDIGGKVSGVIAVTIDVTEQVMARLELEEAEERARLAIAAGNMGTFDFDIFNRTAISSARFYEIFGTKYGADHETLVKCIHSEDRPIRDKAINAALETGRLYYEVRLVHTDGSQHWVRIDGKVISDNTGAPVRMLGTAMDITSYKEVEFKREEYIAIASHELKNPLTSLRLSLELLSTVVKEAGHIALVSKSREQVRKLISLTNELLNVSKISAGVLEINPEIFNLETAIRESIATVEGGSEDLFELSGECDLSIFADRFRIEQVLVNLLSNALKYSPKYSNIQVHVMKEPGSVKIAVTDRGIGIDEENLIKIFKKFSRLNPDKGVEGHGLGLYISEQIVRRHGGDMGVESKKGKGSTFWFRLPH